MAVNRPSGRIADTDLIASHALPSPTDPRTGRPVTESPDGTQTHSSSASGEPDETSDSSSQTGARREVAFGPPAGPKEVGTLGPYRIVRELGRGGMGAVYLAIDTRLNRKLAFKVMLPQFAANASAKERFLREARAAAQITHDHVVTVYEADERDGVPYIAMQFLQGYPLDEYLKRKGSPGISQVVRIAKEAAAGLAAAHRIGLVHRDIKPANLWLEAPKGRIKVLDFGLAKPVDAEVEVTKSGMVVGTPAYMSPEQARAQKVDGRADLFSLGAVLYRLCTGKLPFDGPTTMAVLTALAADEPRAVRELNPAVPVSLANLIHQLLAKNPADRPQTADEVSRRLRAIGEELAHPTLRPAGESPAGAVSILMTMVPESNPFEELDLTVAEPSPMPVAKTSLRHGPNRPWVWLAGAAAAVVVIAVTVGIVIATRKGHTDTKKESPGEVARVTPDKTGKPKPPAPPAVKPPAPVADPDRKAAEWVLSVGGMVKVDGEERLIKAAADLPGDRFALTAVNLTDRPVTDADLANLKGLASLRLLILTNTAVTGEGLVHLKDLTGLPELWLNGTRVTDAALPHLKNLKGLWWLTLARTDVSDAGLAHLKDCKELTELGLNGTRVTDDGLGHLKGFKSLKKLWLNDTVVTDAGLAHLKGHTGLIHLNVQKTRVTAKGVADFQAALPGCMIEWDVGAVEPNK